MNRIMRRLLAVPPAAYALLAATYAGGIWLLSSFPGETFGRHGPFVNFLTNLFHAPLFFGLALLLALALAKRRGPAGEPASLGLARAALAVALAAAFALVDEWHQSFVSGRASDPMDLLTDLAGAACAVVLVRGRLGAELRPARQLGALAILLLSAIVTSALAASTGRRP
jgi:VanZ family protein